MHGGYRERKEGEWCMVGTGRGKKVSGAWWVQGEGR